MKRGKFEGVLNILSFNRHFYISVLLIIAFLSFALFSFTAWSGAMIVLIIVIILFPVIISLVVSHYIYDRTHLYNLPWLESIEKVSSLRILNVNAGFDETSGILKEKFPKANLEIVDFYNPDKHTEVSIERARRLRPSAYEFTRISTFEISKESQSFDVVLLTFAAHEIRNEEERILFFKEIHRVLAPKGVVYVTEHLRDSANFFVYTIGFFHFFPFKSWHKVFMKSGFRISSVTKTTPFVTTFELKKMIKNL